MNKLLKKISIFLFSFLLLNNILSMSVPPESKGDDCSPIIKVEDHNKGEEFPNKFRDIDNLGISGSAQFNPNQLNNILNKYKNQEVTIVDLRQESHGFINDIPFHYHSPKCDPNRNLSSNEVLIKEAEQISQIKKGDTIDFFHSNGNYKRSITAERAYTEKTLVENSGVKYELLAVKDGSIPTPDVVDNFINLYNKSTKSTHYHFHCQAGEGRTTTFLTLYQILFNPSIPLDEILKFQVDVGGIDITDSPKRAAFIETFYRYAKANKLTNYTLPYSTWLENQG